MFSSKKKAQGSAELYFTSGSSAGSKDSSKIFQTNDDIKGHTIFRLPQGVEFFRSRLLLKGVVTTRTDDPRRRGMQREVRTEKLPFLAVALNSTAQPDFHSDKSAVKIPFRFNLEDYLEECTRVSGITELPPSVESRSDARWWSSLKADDASFQYDITYSITATCYSQRECIASRSEQITVLPVLEDPPPLYNSHFAGEYFIGSSSQSPSHGSRRARRGSSPRLQLAGQEPSPIQLDPRAPTSRGSTEVPCMIKLVPRDGLTLNDETLPEQCEMTARLVTRTFITPNGLLKSWESVQEILNDPEAFIRTFRSNEQKFTISLSDWNKYSNSSDQFAMTRFPFVFSLNDDRQLSPDFHTPILSRRYAIEIKLRFPDTTMSNLDLSVPLQIMYETDEYKLEKELTK